MRKISFWLITASNIIILIFTIIGMVKISREFGFNVEKYFDYHGDVICESSWFGIAVAGLGIALLLLFIDYMVSSSTAKRILMIVAIILPFILFVIHLIFRDGFVITMLMSIAFFVPGILLVASENHRAKVIYLVASLFWVCFGIYIIVGLICLLIVGPILAFILCGDRAGIDVYDKFGNFLGRIYED